LNFSAVRGWVSHECLRKVEEQRKLSDPFLSSCTSTFSQSQGLPSSYMLKSVLDHGHVLRLEHFHSHWHLKRGGTPQVLLEPRLRSDPAAFWTMPQSSTRREPSSEAVEAITQPRALPTCSRCHAIGHRVGSEACTQRSEMLPQLAIALE